MNKITEKIKEFYGSKASFCESNGHKYKDFASKLRTLHNRIDWINEFLKPLNLEIIIADRQKGEEKTVIAANKHETSNNAEM